MPGYGDEATWPEYEGHPNDPRESDEDFEDDLEEDIWPQSE
jgi:hypothetical protein